jgi:hypothetical protein
MLIKLQIIGSGDSYSQLSLDLINRYIEIDVDKIGPLEPVYRVKPHKPENTPNTDWEWCSLPSPLPEDKFEECIPCTVLHIEGNARVYILPGDIDNARALIYLATEVAKAEKARSHD